MYSLIRVTVSCFCYSEMVSVVVGKHRSPLKMETVKSLE